MIFYYDNCFIFSKSLSLPSGNFSFGFVLISEALQLELGVDIHFAKAAPQFLISHPLLANFADVKLY